MKNYSIRGIGLYETTTFTGLHKGVSFAGGADGFIAGSGFQDQPSDNTIFMGSSDLTGSYMEF